MEKFYPWSLKRRKSTGIDLVPNEMIKCEKHVLTTPLCILFNYVLKHGAFPKKWNSSIISPIFKDDNSSDLSNYRGVTDVKYIYVVGNIKNWTLAPWPTEVSKALMFLQYQA